MKTRSVLLIATVSMLAAGCSSGPPPIKPGSPAFFWAVARESYRTGDLLKTQATLRELSVGDHEFAGRARIWHLVVSAGVMQGLGDLADAFQAGSEVTAVRFRQEAASLRSRAASTALEFTQAVHEMQPEKAAVVRLAFEFPAGDPAVPGGLGTVSRGGWPADTEREALQRAVLQRGVILAVSRTVGRPDDPAAARTLFQGPAAQVSRETFFFGLAQLLYKGSDLFGPTRLDRSERQLVMCREALETIQLIPETDDTRVLASQIRATLKTIPSL